MLSKNWYICCLHITNTRSDWFFTVPSQAPVNLRVASKTSTSIMVSWQPPPLESRNGIIIGFKLFYKRKGSTDLGHTVNIRNALTQAFANTTRLLKYTEYEFLVLAFTQIGNGPNSSVLVTRTKQDGKSWAVSLSCYYCWFNVVNICKKAKTTGRLLSHTGY